MPSAYYSCQNENFASLVKIFCTSTSKTLFCNALFHMKTKVCLKYSLNDSNFTFHSNIFWLIYMMQY